MVFLFFIASVFVLFVTKAFIALDPDFGWRLRTGYLILQEEIPKTDPYTYSMPSFPWVDHAWAIDVGISLIHSIGGYLGLSLAASLFSLLSLVISNSRVYKDKKFFSFPALNKPPLFYFKNPSFLLAIAVILPFSGIRAQVVTWFMFALFLRVLFDPALMRKLRLYFPFFFIIWTNLHGGFAAGIISLFLVTVTRFIKSKKVDFIDLLVLIFSYLSTFVNPYGEGVWREVWSSVLDSRLRWFISEWGPALLNFDPSYIALLCLSVTFLVTFRKKIPVEESVVFVFFLFQGLFSIRHVPIWVITALPLTTQAIDLFYQQIAKNKISVGMFKKFYTITWVTSLILLIIQSFFALGGAISLKEDKFYPKEAVLFIRQNPPKGQLFSEYGWGGYLIWKSPEHKVFIDGRMPSWRWEANLAKETNSAMDDYTSLSRGKKDLREVFDKYDVTMVLWPRPKPKGFFDYLEGSLGNRLEPIYRLLGIDGKDFDFIEELEKEDWEKVYEDGLSLIYKKP